MRKGEEKGPYRREGVTQSPLAAPALTNDASSRGARIAVVNKLTRRNRTHASRLASLRARRAAQPTFDLRDGRSAPVVVPRECASASHAPAVIPSRLPRATYSPASAGRVLGIASRRPAPPRSASPRPPSPTAPRTRVWNLRRSDFSALQ